MTSTHILKASCGAEVRLQVDEDAEVVTSIDFDSSSGHELDPVFIKEYEQWFMGIFEHLKDK